MPNLTNRPQMDRPIAEPGIGQIELFSLTLSMLCSSLIHHWFTTRFSYFYFIGGSYILFLIEFLTICLPPLLMHTCFGDSVVLTTVLLLSISFFLCNSTRKLRALRTNICRDLKVTILVGTCAVIAAVDCKQIFSPRFAKTQVFGFSPMDLGTGLFVAVKALELLRKDLKDKACESLNKPYSKFENSPIRSLRKVKIIKPENNSRIPRFLPLLLIGVARAIFIEYSGYYQNPIEYGTHWNFFITLAVIEIFISLIQLISPLMVPIISFILGSAYCAFLLMTDFEEYLLGLDTMRNGFLDGNREGIASTFGYLFIFGLTYLVGRFFVPEIIWDDNSTRQGENPNVLFSLVRNLIVQGLIYTFALHQFGLPSRRSANLVYGLHVHCIVTIIILFMHIYQHRVGQAMAEASLKTQLPTLHSAISRNAAYFFLSANLLTGLLNFCRGFIKTPFHEFLSLNGYMFILCVSTKIIDALTTSKSRSLNKD